MILFLPLKEQKVVHTFNALNLYLWVQHLQIPGEIYVLRASYAALWALVIPYQIFSYASQAHYARSAIRADLSHHRQLLALPAYQVIVVILALELDELPVEALVLMMVSQVTLSAHNMRFWCLFVWILEAISTGLFLLHHFIMLSFERMVRAEILANA